MSVSQELSKINNTFSDQDPRIPGHSQDYVCRVYVLKYVFHLRVRRVSSLSLSSVTGTRGNEHQIHLTFTYILRIADAHKCNVLYSSVSIKHQASST
jgi:hypothetical protein